VRISNEPEERKKERGAKNAIYSGHLHLCEQPRAAHALRSDQKYKNRNICQSNSCSNIGTRCSRLLEMAALWQPAIVGWSGISDSQESKFCLNLFWCSEAISLRPLGQILKRAAPLTARDPSLALLTLSGTFWTMVLCMAYQPILGLWLNSIL
jgi:hypothetical protein